ncbi:MAG: lytic transglycosylase domain-containing protein [Pseudomonadota bacterium]
MRNNDNHPGMMAAIRLSGAAAVVFLGACSTPQLLPPGAIDDEASRRSLAAAARAYADSTRAARVAVAIDQPESMRPMTASQIAAEWGTWQPGRTRHGLARTSGGWQKRNGIGLPPIDYSLSIQEMMTNAGCRSCEDKPYHQMVVTASNLHGVPASLIHAVIQKESSYNPAATSRQQARGLMQIMPGTGKYMGVENSQKLYDPQTNINTGAAYLKYLMRSHDTVDKVLAAYNSGPGNVRKYNGVPPFSETRRYVREVKSLYVLSSAVQ